MSFLTSTLSRRTVTRLSSAARLNIVGLVVTAAAMLLQIAAGSTLYPSITGPIVLVGTALLVAFVPGPWTAYAGLVVPLVLGVGAIVAAAMTGGFIDQLANPGNLSVFAGSLLHVVGLVAAVGGGVRMVLDRRAGGRER
jgi:energy-converting hydrogenase Eha subunit C